MKKFLFYPLLIFLIASCSEKADVTDIKSIASSKEFGEYISNVSQMLAESLPVFRDKDLKKEYYDILNKDGLKNFCDWDVSKSSPEVKNLIALNCKINQSKDNLLRIYPVLKNDENFKKAVKYAYENKGNTKEEDLISTQNILNKLGR